MFFLVKGVKCIVMTTIYSHTSCKNRTTESAKNVITMPHGNKVRTSTNQWNSNKIIRKNTGSIAINISHCTKKMLWKLMEKKNLISRGRKSRH